MTSHGKKNKKKYPISWVYVNIQQLLLLFAYCAKCGGKIMQSKPRFTGLAVSVDYVCSLCSIGKQPSTWYSSPSYNHQFMINVKASCSLLMSGLRFQSLQNYWGLMEFPTLSKTRFGELIKKWLFPIIYRMYTASKDNICERLRAKNESNEEVVLCGDAQFDSPGFSAKYCTYTIMNCETNEVVDFAILQKGQVSGGLEHQAFKQVWDVINADEKIKVTDFVIDRQASIAKIINDHYPESNVSYDIWHMAKSLAGHLQTAGKSHPKIKLWHRAIVNHLWYSCKESQGDPDLVVELFHSCLFHVTNIHNWKHKKLVHVSLEGLRQSISVNRPYPKKPVTITECQHGHLSKKDDRSTPWFYMEDEDFEALFKIVTATRFSNDLRRCAKFLHTGKLESFHSMKLLYLPKLYSFEMDTMIFLTMLAAFQNNLCVEGNNLLKSYVVRAYSRANKGYILKNRRTYDNLSFKKALLVDIEENIKSKTVLTHDLNTTYIRKAVPKTFHGAVLPEKEAMLKEKKTRL